VPSLCTKGRRTSRRSGSTREDRSHPLCGYVAYCLD
jgi:hypothetical protein